MSGLVVRSIKVEDFIGLVDANGFGGFMAKVMVNGDFLGVDFEEEFMMSKGAKSTDRIAVRFSDSIGKELGNSELVILKAVKGWIQENLQTVHKAGLSKGQWVNI